MHSKAMNQGERGGMSRRDFLKVAVAGLAGTTLLGTSACGVRGVGQGDNFEIRISHVTPESTPKGMAAERFKRLVEENSEGRITVEVFPNSQLYGDEDEMQAIQDGNVEMLAPSTAKFTSIAPELQALDLPFIIDTPEQVPDTFGRDTAIGRTIFDNENLRSRNIQALSLWDSGFKQIFANRAIQVPEDLEGVQVRVQPSDVIRSYFNTWGASPTNLSAAEVYNGLQQGVVDSVEAAFGTAYSLDWHTVQSHVTESNHGYIGYILVINQEFYDSLPDDLQTVVTEAADEASRYNRDLVFESDAEAKDDIVEEGSTELTELSEEERQAFKGMVVPEIWDEFSDVVGSKIIEQLKQQNASRQ